MIREVDFVDYYLPPFMQTYKEPVATLDAEQPEFQLVWKAADRVLYNRFISTADGYGISRFEKLLGIYPSAEDNLESRRARVQARWFNKLPYTMRMLIEKLREICGNSDFTLRYDFDVGYTLTLHTELELFGQVEELEHIINMMVPENIVVDSQNNIPCNASGVVFLSGGMCFTNSFIITNDFREIYSAGNTAVFGGGIVRMDEVQVSDAFSETYSITGSAALFGGVVETALLKISQDFDETIRADSLANIGGGIVQVDFIEIANE